MRSFIKNTIQFRLIKKILIFIYVAFGKQPWSIGYWESRNEYIDRCIRDNDLVNTFKKNEKLPKYYGFGYDERVIEYPWIISRIRKEVNILDAGSVMNFDFLIKHPSLSCSKIIICNLEPETNKFFNKKINYLYFDYGDIRHLPLRDNYFDLVICGSVIEHVGMDNTLLYSKSNTNKEDSREDYLKTIVEMTRVTKKGGKILVTVPYGEYSNLGWMQQFNRKMIDKIKKIFPGKVKISYYKYSSNGWKLSNKKDSDRSRYFDIHIKKIFSSNKKAAAGAVACLEMIKV